MEKISTDQIVKIGIVVENIEEAVKNYAEIFRIEVPKVNVPKPDAQPDPRAYTIYRGEKRKVRCKTAIVPLKPIYIELIEPLEEPSPWNEFKEAHGQGVHYVAMNIEGFEEHIQLMDQKGMPVIQKTEKGKERYAYFDSVEKLGITLEFKEVDKN